MSILLGQYEAGASCVGIWGPLGPSIPDWGPGRARGSASAPDTLAQNSLRGDERPSPPASRRPSPHKSQLSVSVGRDDLWAAFVPLSGDAQPAGGQTGTPCLVPAMISKPQSVHPVQGLSSEEPPTSPSPPPEPKARQLSLRAAESSHTGSAEKPRGLGPTQDSLTLLDFLFQSEPEGTHEIDKTGAETRFLPR